VEGTHQAPPIRLTEREAQVLRWLVEGKSGKSGKKIASLLAISKRTVDFHIANLYDKLQVSNRVQAFREAMRRNLLSSFA
jgi:DNA-binding CsgD family transcriptional regulator